MGRIRTVKPEFYRHEKLQDLEAQNPGQHVMLVFSGLWTLCDSKGKFLYKPRTIRLDILPFIPFDINKTLDILRDNGFIQVYKVDGENYGMIPSFLDHQRITGREASEGERFPDPPETTGKQQGNNEETTGKHLVAQEGKGREKEGKGDGKRNGFHHDGFSTGQEAFEEIKNDEMFVENLLLAVRGAGFGSCNEITLTKAARYFIMRESAKSDFVNRTKTEFKNHLVSWATKYANELHKYS